MNVPLKVQKEIKNLPHAKQLMLHWLASANPALYREVIDKAMQKMHGQMQGMGQTSTGSTSSSGSSFWDSLTSTIKGIGTAASTIVPTVMNAQTNKKILDTQLKLAEQGKPPLNTAQIQTPPTATVSFGTSPGIQMAMWAALGLGGIWLISRMAKK